MDIDFITLAKIIFKDKDKYKFVTDKEKSDCFFKLNRKFAFQNLKKAQFFNNKNIDKSVFSSEYQQQQENNGNFAFSYTLIGCIY